MRIAPVGLGTTGSHIARQLTQTPAEELMLFDVDNGRLEKVGAAVRAVARNDQSVRLGKPDPIDPPDAVVLATPTGHHLSTASEMLALGAHVVSLSDDPDEVTDLLGLDAKAEASERTLVVGAGFSPGLSCVLARYAADQLDSLDLISVYHAGTGGPACARQHHQALKRSGEEWIDGGWASRTGGSGRDLAWFPEPFGARDCYRGALPSPRLLQKQFPEATRISARMAATRRDRFTSRLPMLRPPHDDGGPGGIRVEVRGRSNTAVETVILGVMDHPSVVSASVATFAVVEALAGRAPLGANGLATWPEPGRTLAELRRSGVRVAAFSGLLDAAS